MLGQIGSIAMRGTVLGLAALSAALVGCAGTQLKYNTLDIASTITAIHTNQVLENLSRFIDEPYALPSQVDITSGTIQTSNSITPAVTTPLSRGSTRNAGGAFTSLTTAGAGVTVGASDTWLQSWLVTPISDSANLANIMALYHYVIYGSDPKVALPPAALKLAPRRIFWNGVAADGTVNPPPEGVEVVSLGHFGNHDLYISREDFNEGYLTHLVLLVLPTTPPTAPSKGKKAIAATRQHAVTGPGSVRTGEGKPSILIVPQTLVEPR
jgi:hypothetical protein